MPFIGVMMANYLIPVYISDILKANASVYAIEGTMYGVGAVVAGICIPLIMKYVKTEVSIVMTMFIYVISITVMIIEPSVIFFIWTCNFFMQLEMRVQEWREMY